MKIQNYKASADIIAFLNAASSATPALRSFTTSLVSIDAGPLRIDIVGTGMDIDANNGTWKAGSVAEIRMFQAGTPLLTFSNLGMSTARGTSLASTLQAALSNSGGSDEFIGSDFRDDWQMGAGNDTIRTGLGNDLLWNQAGDDLLDGGSGMDVLATPGPSSAYSLVLDSTKLGGTLRDLRTGSPDGTDTLVSIEYIEFTDGVLSLPAYDLGGPRAPDALGTQVYRFAKIDNGQYFYSGSAAERDLIIASMPSFRYEGPVYNAQDNWVTGYDPVYRFANLSNGGYFYTASANERDLVFSNYPHFRYEGATFFVPAAAGADTVPVYRLANTSTGGYLFTTSSAERSFAVSLGMWRDEGVAFPAPRTMATAFAPETDDAGFAATASEPAVADFAAPGEPAIASFGEIWSIG